MIQASVLLKHNSVLKDEKMLRKTTIYLIRFEKLFSGKALQLLTPMKSQVRDKRTLTQPSSTIL